MNELSYERESLQRKAWEKFSIRKKEVEQEKRPEKLKTTIFEYI